MVNSGFLPINGTQLYYEELGDGPILILLHSGVADLRMWDDQFTFFANNFRVIRYDMRGFGRSKDSSDECSHVEDLRLLMEYLGIVKAHLLGVSLGGTTIIDIALEYPQLVDSLILVSSGLEEVGWDDYINEFQNKRAKAFNKGNLERVKELNLEVWFAGPKRTLSMMDAALKERVYKMLRPPGVWIKPIQATPPAHTRLEDISARTFVLIGDYDVPDLLRRANILATRIPRAQSKVMKGVAHYSNMESPEEFNSIILDFILSEE